MENTSLSIGACAQAITVHEAQLSEMPPGTLENDKAWDQWCKTLDVEHKSAEGVVPELCVADESDRKQLSLRTRQVMAFQALARGKSVVSAARDAGVGRSTLHRWMKEDPNFKAALARQAEEQMAAAREELKNSVEPAARAIHQAVRDGHVTAAMHVLKSVGLMGARSQVSSEPSARSAVSHRAAQALETRLGQLLSMLAKQPEIAGALENAKATPVQDPGGAKQLPQKGGEGDAPTQESPSMNSGQHG